jgi:hypothetical protein
MVTTGIMRTIRIARVAACRIVRNRLSLMNIARILLSSLVIHRKYRNMNPKLSLLSNF